MSKIVKKADLDVLIESTLKKAGIKIIKEDNIGDYYLSSGNTNKWFDKNDSSYDMQGEDWEEESYDNFEDWSNSPYGQDTEYKGNFNPRVRDSEKWFNRYRDVNGPVKVRRARMTPSNAPMIQEEHVGGVNYDKQIAAELKAIVGDLTKLTPYVLEKGDNVEMLITGKIQLTNSKGKTTKKYENVTEFLKGIGYQMKMESKSSNKSLINEELERFNKLTNFKH